MAAAKRVFWLTTTLGVAGAIRMVSTSDALTAALANQLPLARHGLFEGEIVFGLADRIAANLLYPAAVLGALVVCSLKPTRWRYYYVLFPFGGLLTWSFASGGRGPISIGSLFIFWILIVGGKKRAYDRGRLVTICVLLAMVAGYFYYIAWTRELGGEALAALHRYVTGPIPAFSAWLKLGHLSPMLRMDLSTLAPIREILGTPRVIDRDAVFIPFGFNVFTHLAEHLRYLGVPGMVMASYLLGVWSGTLETAKTNPSRVAVRSCLYAYLTYSIWSDLAFFVIGWWIAIATSVIVLPALVDVRKVVIRSRRTGAARQPSKGLCDGGAGDEEVRGQA